MEVRFTIPGEPQGKARARTCRNGHSFTPEKTVLYENLIKTEYARQCGNSRFTVGKDGKTPVPVEVGIAAYYGVPKSYSKRKSAEALEGALLPTKKPDADNIAKVVCDALNGIAYIDDTQVVCLKVVKAFGDPHVDVVLKGRRYGDPDQA